MTEEELARLGAISEELRLSLNKRDSVVARTAARVWVKLNEELVRIDARLKSEKRQEAARE